MRMPCVLCFRKGKCQRAEADGSTALHWASLWDDLELADRLIRAGADVNVKRSRRHAALTASQNGAPQWSGVS
jgi:hypothetical protein